MEYQNRPVEWITTETEKIAKDKENNNVRDGVLLGSGLAAIDAGAGINHKPTSKVRKALKTGLRIHGGYNVAAGTLAAGGSEYVRRAAATPAIATKAGVLRNKGLAYTGVGAAELIGSKYINTNPVNKKLLAAKLGLVTGGVAAAAAGAHGLLTEKRASKKDQKKNKPESGYKRLGKALLGYPAAAVTGFGAGMGIGLATIGKPRLRARLVLPTAAALGLAAHGNALYQGYKYIQEH